MTTLRDIVSAALKEAGIVGVGQTPLDEDITDGFNLLRKMIASWQQQRWLVPSTYTVSRAWNGAISNTIGLGGSINVPRPDKILSGYFIQNNVNNPVSLPLKPIFSREDYNLVALKSLNAMPEWFFYDNAYPLGNIYIWPIPSSIYTIYLSLKGYLGFPQGVTDGSITSAGAGYTNNTYNAVLLTGGSGEGASADITVTAGVVSIVTLATPGNGYAIGDVLSADAASLGGAGAGFQYTVNSVASNLDSEFTLPDEYEEAVHYNLSLRLISWYDKPMKPSVVALAKAGRNVLRTSNAQIPTLLTPQVPNARGGFGFNLYNPDGYPR